MRLFWGSLAVLMLLTGCIDVPQDAADPDPAPSTLRWSWTQGPSPGLPRGEAACTSDGDGRILIAGGLVEPAFGLIGGFDATGRVEVYDNRSKTWETAPDLPVGVHHHAISYAADRYWVTGGYPGPTFTPSDLFVSWAPGESSWRFHDRMPVARGAHGAAVVDDRIILVGGVTPSGVTDRVDSYDPETGEWTRLKAAPTAREHLAVDAIGDTVYIAGGRNNAFDSKITAFDIYNATTDTWRRGPSLPTPRGGSSGTGGPHGFAVAGGEATGGTFAQVELYDPRTGTWQRLPDDPAPRHGLCIAALGDALHVITGGHEAGFAVSDTHNVLQAGPRGNATTGKEAAGTT